MYMEATSAAHMQHEGRKIINTVQEELQSGRRGGLMKNWVNKWTLLKKPSRP